MKTTFGLLLLLLTLICCDPVQELEVINLSDDTVFFELSHNRRLEIFPIQKESNGDTAWEKMNFAFPSQRTKLPLIGKNGWRNFINKKCVDSTLTIFFFDDELLKRVSKDSLLENQLFTEKFAYKVKDLEMAHWRIEFPESQ